MPGAPRPPLWSHQAAALSLTPPVPSSFSLSPFSLSSFSRRLSFNATATVNACKRYALEQGCYRGGCNATTFVRGSFGAKDNEIGAPSLSCSLF